MGALRTARSGGGKTNATKQAIERGEAPVQFSGGHAAEELKHMRLGPRSRGPEVGSKGIHGYRSPRRQALRTLCALTGAAAFAPAHRTKEGGFRPQMGTRKWALYVSCARAAE